MENFIEFEGKQYKSLKDLQELYHIKLKKYLTENPGSNEWEFVKIERPIYSEILTREKSLDTLQELFRKTVRVFLMDFFNKKSFVSEHKYGPIQDDYPGFVKWFEGQFEEIKDEDLQLKFIDQQIERNENVALSWINNGVDFTDRHKKAQFEAGQKFTDYLKDFRRQYFRRQFEKLKEDKEFKLNPTGDFQKLKQHRLSLFEAGRKKIFLLSRKESKTTTTQEDIDQCYLLWLNDEPKVIDQWLSDFYPNGQKKSIKETDSRKVEIIKYKNHISAEIVRVTNQLQKMPIRVNSGTDLLPIDEFSIIEKMIDDFSYHNNLFKEEFMGAKSPDQKKKFIEERNTDQPGAFLDETKYFETRFDNEIDRSHKSIIAYALSIAEVGLKNSYITQIYLRIKSLSENNNERILFWGETKIKKMMVIHAHYMMSLKSLQESIEREFEHLLDKDLVYNTDEKKFEQSILCSTYEEQKVIYEKQHNPGCKCIERANKTLTDFYYRERLNFRKKYEYFVKKWIGKNTSVNPHITEADFVKYMVQHIDELFVFNSEDKTYTATDFTGEVYTYRKEFYDQHVGNHFISMRHFLVQREQEIKSISGSINVVHNTNQNKVYTPESAPQEYFCYTKISTRPEAITDLLSQLKKHSFIHPDTKAADFKKVFSGKAITGIIWIGTATELKYLFKLLLNDPSKLNAVSGSHWQITGTYFVNSKNLPFNIEKFKDLKTPRPGRAVILEKMVEKM